MIDVIVLPQPVHRRAYEQASESVRRELVADVALHFLEDPADLIGAASRARPAAALLICPGEAPDLVVLLGAHWPSGRRIARFDAAARQRDQSPALAAHVQGRGVLGFRWALRSVVYHDRHQFLRSSYGSEADQYGQLLMPSTPAARHPVAVLIHGGFWRDRWQLDLMDGIAADLAAHGIAAWNVEYRRPDVHGWHATTTDVRASVAHLRSLASSYPIDVDRVVLLGHSAGGQLAAHACADLLGDPDSLQPVGCVSLAGAMDVVETARRRLGEAAAQAALGVSLEDDASIFLDASPLHRLPIGVPTVIVTAEADNLDLNEMCWRYLDAAAERGDRVEGIQGQGDHFTLIDPGSLIWQRTRQRLEALVE